MYCFSAHIFSLLLSLPLSPIPVFLRVGSTGVLPPPEGYLKRLREICTKHGILLIFDEVITGFGRLGASFAAEKFDVNPDMITCAKGMTNGVVPAGAVICREGLYSTVMDSANREGKGSHIEFFHGYTYSGHPLAMAAGIATLQIYEEEKLFQRADDLAPYFQEALHSLKGLPNVVDVRNCGLMGAVEFAPVPGLPTKRAGDIFDRCFKKKSFVRPTGSTVAMSPPLCFEKKDVDRLITTLAESIVESSKQLDVNC